MADPRIAIPGSARDPVPGHRVVGPADLAARDSVTLYLRSRAQVPADLAGPLSREDYAANYGADPADVERIRQFAAAHALTVGPVDLGRRSVVLEGTLASLSAAFMTQLVVYLDPATGSTYRGRTGALTVPSHLGPSVHAVFGLDIRPQASPHLRIAPHATTSYTPPQIAKLYNFPTNVSGLGQCVAIVELGGGFAPADLQTYFSSLGIPLPQVIGVGVDGGTNSPGVDTNTDGEVMLDIEVIGGVAPGAKIVVYFAPNTEQGFVDAVSTAVHDTQNRPSVVSISWGSSETNFTAAGMQQMEQAFAAGAALGVTVTAACGDNGSTDGATDGLQHVDFPSSAPHALGCGGTTIQNQGVVLSSETVWNSGGGGGATGGGISDTFPLPSYQQAAGVPPSVNPGGHVGRGVPDVSGDADPASGYIVRVDGQQLVIGGTSAVAPLWAGLIALLNQSLGHPVGFLHPTLYGPTVTPTMRDIVSGSNGAYSAHAGWDACTGLGSPNGARLLQALGAGSPPPTPTPTPTPTPHSHSNPDSHASADASANPDADSHPYADASANPDADPHPYADADPGPHPYASADSGPHADADTYADSGPHSFSHAVPHASADTGSDAHASADTRSDADTYADSGPHSLPHAVPHADAASDAHARPDFAVRGVVRRKGECRGADRPAT